jgi:hypothetical protein
MQVELEHQQSVVPSRIFVAHCHPFLSGDKVSLQLWGDIILEHLQHDKATLTTAIPERMIPSEWAVNFPRHPCLSFAPKRSLPTWQRSSR